MSSISGVSASSVSSSYASMTAAKRQRPDAAKMAEDIFSKLDTKGQGYIEKSDLQSALGALSVTDGTNTASGAASSTTSSVDDLFSKLDGDGDGKVTKKELADSMQGLADALDSQAMSSRMQMGGMPPPEGGHHGHDAGLTKDQLTSMASDAFATDSKRASVMSDVASNFDKADTNGDGKVSFKEAMAYEKSTKADASSATGSDASAADGASSETSASANATQEDTQARMMQQLMQLIHAYGDNSKTAQSSSISVAA
jgi:Ca2+-binding EF-hand superfamily protein